MELENYGSFCYSGDCTNPIWNCYDEALVSPELMYSINSYRYLKRIGDRDLIAKVRPNSKISDHLPLLVFTIELSVDASWLDATGADGGVACLGGSLASARFVTPAGGTFGADSVVDASGAVAPHVVVEPDVATPPTGETDRGEVPGDSADKSPADANPAAGEPTTGPTTNPALKPAAATTKTTTTVTKTTVAKVLKPKAATATTAALPKTGDTNWIAASVALFLLGTVLLAAAYRC